MSLVIYNSYIRQKERFVSLNPGYVRMYVCGVTVYDDAHIGHARCYVTFDVIFRHLKIRGYKVNYVRNFTDIDDKIINRALELGLSWSELADRYIVSFIEDMNALGVLPVTVMPRVSEHISEVIIQIQELINRSYAYVLSNGDVYFSVDKFVSYGNLSGRSLKFIDVKSRLDVNLQKHNPLDFVLWKISKPGEPFWDSPWGNGRPGWHIECSAMSYKYLSWPFDIHGGGKDLLFPHHENELAQAEAVTGGDPFVRYWVHNGFVQIDSQKMSKSLGNYITIKNILKTIQAEALRLFLLSSHYRSPLHFSIQAVKDAAISLERLYNTLLLTNKFVDSFVEPSSILIQEIEKIVCMFEQAMDDDFNTAIAISSLFILVRIINRLAGEPVTPIRDAGLNFCGSKLRELGNRLGILDKDPQLFLQGKIGFTSSHNIFNSSYIDHLIAVRQNARLAKNFFEADRIRDKIDAMGVILEDTPYNTTRWRLKK